ncbi:MAG: phosphoglucomutase (alpha-D-glucose-1,6-bisphosphate-dependent) [Kofleriaceae bacterium]
MTVSPLAGLPAPSEVLVDVARLITVYYADVPDPAIAAQRVAFGTSGHRGSSFHRAFNEWHILAITQAICLYRRAHGVDGPLFIGIDTHALSVPAFETALAVLAANDVDVRISQGGEYTPTPAVSHAILVYNRGRTTGLADGIVVTPSHNPPEDGGFKYNPSNGGPADTTVTGWIEASANALLEGKVAAVRRMPFDQALRASTTREHDYLSNYVADLGNVIDFDVIRGSGIRLGVDPLGGAGVHYWARIAEVHRLDLTVVSDVVDKTFAFMTLDWDGRIRMDPSSAYAMRRLIALKDRYDIAFACDTDHDRHGIVTRSAGLMPPNHYLAVAVDYLFGSRTQWGKQAAIGKTVVTSALLERVAGRLGRKLYDVPVGFKWFVDGLYDGSLGFGGEESAGAAFLRRDGTVWTTDKDGLAPALLSAEITARSGRDPGELYRALTAELGEPTADRVEAPATREQKQRLARLSAAQIELTELGGEPVVHVLDRAPGNDAPIGGIKVMSANSWFAARPSGTEEIYKIYGESFRGAEHLRQVLREAQDIVDRALNAPASAAAAP